MALMLLSACTGASGDPASSQSPTAPASPTSSTSSVATIPQPPAPEGIAVASEDERVDLEMPTFSDPTNITNPMFPVSRQASVLMLGHVDGEPFRSEVMLLPETRIVEWEGERVEVAVSQYNAFLDGRIEEIAYDLYAQADDGSVWYFGEDVFDFRDGTIVVTEGTWLAGRDGPAAMIMPGDPQPGDVYRTENAPGFVFEEVTVRSVSERVRGPLGPIDGSMVASELHDDGTTERKLFAPGYGEFFTSDGKDVEALALAVPTDAEDRPLPDELAKLTRRALDAERSAGAGDWNAAAGAAADVASSWKIARGGEVPRLIAPRLDAALEELTAAVRARAEARARTGALEVARFGYDLQLRFRPVTEVNLARMDLWAAQLIADQQVGDVGGVGSDAFALDYVRDRVRAALEPETLLQVNEALGTIQVAVVDEELGPAAKAAERLRRIIGSTVAM